MKKNLKKNKNISVINNPKEKEKNNLLKTCSLLVLPSTTRSEAFGLVLLEAAKYSKPVITTQLNTGTSFIVKNNYNGFIIEPNNATVER